ncbi:ribosomal protein S12 methylthiotransferase accessory factor [Aromatoleum tolulyticum]|uniref:Ribosomal protein S12 methylthiotransferase accessory factor n=1 Tax=Aromatoleum tolulyticum TaxID=34027 RepID=A0A1N6NFA0_9RHOO|nr:YcaO-like family protein [Aromatoleum tolulyticum]SIP90770.1 ribosomal protein S12 methylthiotransferase accessory factor [Aromatoleum tolulyticum]
MLTSAASLRCGLLLEPQFVAAEACDLPGLFNVAVPEDPSNPWQTVSGAVGVTRESALIGAIAEGLERYAAAFVAARTLPRSEIPATERLDEGSFACFADEQLGRPDFPWATQAQAEDLFAEVFSLLDNRSRWVPQEWVGLGPRTGTARLPSTSSGLAAFRPVEGGPWMAMLRATEELLERDALATTWLNGLGGREIPLPAAWREQVQARGGEAYAFDMTQEWNPHPVVAVAGGIPRRGEPRHCLGIACRATRDEALQKAWLEWGQALTFAGFLKRTRDAELPRHAAQLRRFDEHAVFYTLRPDLWSRTALIAHREPFVPVERFAPAPAAAIDQLDQLVHQLANSGVDLYYRELTTRDVAAAGLHVIRVLSPQLTGLHADERAPFLGGRCKDVRWRYGNAPRFTAFPNPLPHPLG